MKAIIPVAGVGTRLRPHTFSHPKVLLNVAGKPIIGHIMDKLISAGIDEAIVIVGYLGNMVEDWLRKNYSIKLTFVTQAEMLGLAHAIWMCKPYVNPDEPVFIILGDTIFDVDLQPVLQSTISTLGVHEVVDPRRFGVAVTKNGRIVKLIEKPDQPISNLAIVGLYFLSNAGSLFSSIDHIIDNEIRTKGEYQLTDALQLMIEHNEPFTTFPVVGWYDCGKPETLLSTNETLLQNNPVTKAYPGCIINDPVFIAENASIENAIIGPNATIGEHAVITDAIIKDSIIGNSAKVSSIMIDNSIIGNSASISGSPQQINIGDCSEIRLR
ncbi:MAG: NTP transferase domain-containing protein [Chlorobium sp.]|jgi:glucose-1-phosphate thymidylyltransferase|uniref:sugar phosphate nucleotidyltransferase n=1 Tax=Chlorobium sp. TaxID=1095 RepID=UPI001D5161BC|nr:sugar phosphate nucleotidyltransferase [Chlorobium sp.]MBN1279477.1 NTP transferase domain-containing protein [Chlorobiaceae bacterium]MCF8216501.1 NTP transferase domain-containing protein [Chlorobium sp.]MCF8271406.1 NTP transferase domain-containing protein [Chlorobium sp.]MCF8287778.1 NTP transferase domain-containing protein [Chlorobium sp.]MCF8291317.1 NTP transferase domain-containing protein [Chlorobium sp.]